jgi:hypothetical protein
MRDIPRPARDRLPRAIKEEAMMKTFVRAAFVASLMGGMVCTAALLPPPARAADDSKAKKDQGPGISKEVMIPLYAAQKAMQDGDYPTAMEKIKAAEAVPVRTPEDDYQINKFKAYIALDLKDNDTAFAAFEAMANSPMLVDEDKVQTYTNAFVLSAMLKNNDNVIKYGKLLDAVKPLDDKGLAIISQAYYLNKDVPDANTYAQKSVDAAKAEGKDADPFVLQLLLNLQAKTNPNAAVETLEQIAASDPSPNSYQQLTGLALATPGIRDLDALYIYRLRFMAGGMKVSDDYTIMANIALQLGYPEEAKEVLEQGVNTGKVESGYGTAGGLLAKAKTDSAADRAALPQIAAAADKSKTGEQDVKLAEDYWGYGRYADAEAAARRAIAKGGLKDPSEGNLILGISLVAQGKNIEAQEPLSKVDGSQARAKAGHLWYLFAEARAKQMHETDVAPGTAAPPAQPAQPSGAAH